MEWWEILLIVLGVLLFLFIVYKIIVSLYGTAAKERQRQSEIIKDLRRWEISSEAGELRNVLESEVLNLLDADDENKRNADRWRTNHLLEEAIREGKEIYKTDGFNRLDKDEKNRESFKIAALSLAANRNEKTKNNKNLKYLPPPKRAARYEIGRPLETPEIKTAEEAAYHFGFLGKRLPRDIVNQAETLGANSEEIKNAYEEGNQQCENQKQSYELGLAGKRLPKRLEKNENNRRYHLIGKIQTAPGNANLSYGEIRENDVTKEIDPEDLEYNVIEETKV